MGADGGQTAEINLEGPHEGEGLDARTLDLEYCLVNADEDGDAYGEPVVLDGFQVGRPLPAPALSSPLTSPAWLFAHSSPSSTLTALRAAPTSA